MTGIGYREQPATLPGAVRWTNVLRSGAVARVLPDGCLDLVRSPGGQLLVAGPDRAAQLVPGAPGAVWLGLRLPPGLGPAVLGVPALELLDRRVPLAALWGDARAGLLERRLAGSSAVEATALLDAVARRRLSGTDGGGPSGRVRPDPAMLRLVHLLRSGQRVDRAAAAVGMGERQVHRRSLVAFGYGPKTLARILRLGRALDLARSGVPPAQVAADAGFADQPHLAREVRALAGVPLRRLLTG